jgi:hypothetical protein
MVGLDSEPGRQLDAGFTELAPCHLNSALNMEAHPSFPTQQRHPISSARPQFA